MLKSHDKIFDNFELINDDIENIVNY